jgi:hypothetical protein
MPVGGGEEKRILDRAGEHDWFNWALARNGIYFLDHRGNGAVLEFFDFETGKTTTVLTSNRPQSVGLAVTADGRSILYVESELEESSIMLVKNFR